jgi:hypothetical protein
MKVCILTSDEEIPPELQPFIPVKLYFNTRRQSSCSVLPMILRVPDQLNFEITLWTSCYDIIAP